MSSAVRKLQCYPGERYGRLIVIEPAGRTKNYGHKWLCRCDCGKTSTPTEGALKRGTLSCGCLNAERLDEVRGQSSKTHGMAHGKNRTPEYRAWTAMKTRCYNKNNPSYPNWGGRGITVCDRWRNSFETFLADMGPRPSGTSLDRYPNQNGNYEPSNCRWASPVEQARNTRKVKLTDDVRAEIDKRLAAGEFQWQVAQALGITQGAITNYVTKKTWRKEGEQRIRSRRYFPKCKETSEPREDSQQVTGEGA